VFSVASVVARFSRLTGGFVFTEVDEEFVCEEVLVLDAGTGIIGFTVDPVEVGAGF
jgi:hypothetical protein